MATNTAKYAIFKAKINGVLTEIFAKSHVQNVYVDDDCTVTLAAKLAEIITDIASKASSTDLTNGLAAKADKVHTHAEGDITGLSDKLATFATTSAMNTAISTAISELIGGAPETYDTLKEVAEYIATHADVVAALNEAIGKKATKEEFNALKGTVDALGALAGKSIVTEDLLDETLKEKINAAYDGNHSHSNKELLDTYDQTNADLKDAVAKKHGHENKTVLDGITEDTVNGWNAKSKVYIQSTEPAAMTEQDLWVQIVE